MNRILGIGNALVDIIIPTPDDGPLNLFALPKGSMTHVSAEQADRIMNGTDAMDRLQAAGGSAANTIHGLAALGVSTGFLGKTGRDRLGDYFLSELLAEGVRTTLLHGSSRTGTAIAFITPDSERTFATHLGAAVELEAGEIAESMFSGYDLLHIEGYLVQNHALVERALRQATAAGLKVSIDLASFNVVAENLDFIRRMVKDYADLVFANEEESVAFTGERDPKSAAAIISSHEATAVVKLGAKGSLIRHEGQSIPIPAATARPLDTTGAGDLYAAGFLYGLSAGLPLERCGHAGSLLAARVIEVYGARIPAGQWPALREQIKAL